MRVQHGPRPAAPGDLDVQERLGGGSARRPADDAAALVALQDVRGSELPLRDATPCNRQAQRLARHHHAEIAARAECPSARVKAPADAGERGPDGGEALWRHRGSPRLYTGVASPKFVVAPPRS